MSEMSAAPTAPGFSFFVPVMTYPDPAPVGNFDRILEFAAALGGAVRAQILEIEIPPVVNPLPVLAVDVAAMAEEAEARSRASGVKLADALRQQADRLGLPLVIDKTCARGELAGGRLAASARAHDMTLLCMLDTFDYRDLAEAILFDSGGPAILFPATGGPTGLDTVAIAWDGSRAAARAVHDALPILAHAERAIVLTADRDKSIGSESTKAIMALLEHHGIDAVHEEVLMVERTVIGDALQEAALRKNAGLLVMGGYGHNRLREFVLGGATKSLLETRRLPVLMSH